MKARASGVAEVDTCTARWHCTYSARKRHGCTCPSAKDAKRRYVTHMKAGSLPDKTVDSRGTRRRLQGLAAARFTMPQVLEVTSQFGCYRIKELYWQDRPRVRVETERAVRKAVEILGAQPEPRGWQADRMRNTAEKRGWWPLDFWDDIDNDSDPEPVPDGVDEIAVMHALAGDMHWQQLGPLERRTVVAEMRQRGISISDIAVWLRGSLGSVNAACDVMRAPRDRRRRRVS
jgi:hypothetical protein